MKTETTNGLPVVLEAERLTKKEREVLWNVGACFFNFAAMIFLAATLGRDNPYGLIPFLATMFVGILNGVWAAKGFLLACRK
jgi:hypothetical protein